METLEFYLKEVEKLENVDIDEKIINGEIEIPPSAINGDTIDCNFIFIEHQERIINLIDKALKLDPNNPDLYLKKAKLLNEYDFFPIEFTQIVDLLDIAISIDSNNANSYFVKAEELRRSFSSEYLTTIVDSYDMAIKLDPNNAEYYLKKSLYSYDRTNYPLGSKLYKKAIELKKDDLNFIAEVAKELIICGRDFEALEIYDDLISENNDLPVLYYLRANQKAYGFFAKDFSWYCEDWSENENRFAEAKASRSYDRDSLVQQYKIEALNDIEKALELRPNDEDFLNLKEEIISMEDDY